MEGVRHERPRLGRRVAGEEAVGRVEEAGLVDRDQDVDALAAAEIEVLGSAARSDVHDPRSLVRPDVLPGDDAVADPGLGLELLERRVVRTPHERASRRRPLDLRRPRRRAASTRSRHDPREAALGADGGVRRVRPDGGDHVRRQRPGRGRPDEQALAVGGVGERELDVEGGMLEVPVGVRRRHLVLGQGGAAAGAPGHRAMAPVEPAGLVAHLQEVPDVLDVRVRHRVVRPLPVHPLAEPPRLLGLEPRVGRHPVPAGPGEAVEAVLLDLPLRVEAEGLLHLDLDPEALAVEPVLVAELVAPRGVEALVEVLQRPAPGVVHAHRVVRGDRPVDEAPRLGAPAGLAPALEGLLAVPELQDPLLEGGRIELRGEAGVTGSARGHGGPS